MKQKDIQSQLKAKEIVFTINPSVYPLEAIYTTCYVFLDRFYLFLDKEQAKIKVFLKPKEGIRLGLDACCGEFMNELLNNTLRFLISKKNQKIREMIIQEALFFSQPQKELDIFLKKKRV